MRDPRDYDDKQLELQLMEVTQDPTCTKPGYERHRGAVHKATLEIAEDNTATESPVAPKLH